MRLNLGCGKYPMEGFLNVDMESPLANLRGDFTTMTFGDVEEVVMEHVLEHISWQETDAVLRRIRSWMRVGAFLRVEVPDHDTIVREWVDDPLFEVLVYGIQTSQGEYHKACFTGKKLSEQLRQAGFAVTNVSRFLSEHPSRTGIPCLSVEAVAR